MSKPHRNLRWLMVGVLVLAGCAAPASAPAPPPVPPPTSAQVGQTTLVAIAPPAPAHPTLPEFLGLKGLGKGLFGLVRGVGSRIRNRLASRFPGLEGPGPVKSFAEAGAAEDAAPADKTAAEIKAEEDKAQQKIKSLRFLAKLGCSTCYPGVEEAFLSGLEDCTEAVRFEAAKAIRKTTGDPCVACNEKACCTPNLLKALDQMVQGINHDGCPFEPSPRVRRQARLALAQCGGALLPVDEGGEFPAEGPPPRPTGDGLAGAPRGTANTSAPAAEFQLVAYWEEVPSPRRDLPVARVNGDAVMESELVARHLAATGGRLPVRSIADIPEPQLQAYIRSALERKLVAQEARRHLSAEEIAELVSRRDTSGTEAQEDYRAALLREEAILRDEWLGRVTKIDLEVDAWQLQARYQQEFRQRVLPAEVQWEQMSVDKEHFSSPQEAYAALEFLRNRALGLSVEPPAEFRRQALVTRQYRSRIDRLPPRLAELLTTLPARTMSELVEDADSFHLYYVVDRQPARPATLDEIRDEVREAIWAERRARFQETYVRQLMHRAEYWQLDEPAVAAGDSSASLPLPITAREFETSSSAALR